MEIFNLFIRRFLTIKFNGDVINKSGGNSLIPWEFFLLLAFSWFNHNFDVGIGMAAWKTWKVRKVEPNLNVHIFLEALWVPTSKPIKGSTQVRESNDCEKNLFSLFFQALVLFFNEN